MPSYTLKFYEREENTIPHGGHYQGHHLLPDGGRGIVHDRGYRPVLQFGDFRQTLRTRDRALCRKFSLRVRDAESRDENGPN